MPFQGRGLGKTRFSAWKAWFPQELISVSFGKTGQNKQQESCYFTAKTTRICNKSSAFFVKSDDKWIFSCKTVNAMVRYLCKGDLLIFPQVTVQWNREFVWIGADFARFGRTGEKQWLKFVRNADWKLCGKWDIMRPSPGDHGKRGLPKAFQGATMR